MACFVFHAYAQEGKSWCYWDDIPDELGELAVALEEEPLQWCGGFDVPWEPSFVAPPTVQKPRPRPPKLTKFREEVEELSDRLGLNDEIKRCRYSFSIPNLNRITHRQISRLIKIL